MSNSVIQTIPLNWTFVGRDHLLRMNSPSRHGIVEFLWVNAPSSLMSENPKAGNLSKVYTNHGVHATINIMQASDHKLEVFWKG